MTSLVGHRLPSGVGFRRAFVEVLVRDAPGPDRLVLRTHEPSGHHRRRQTARSCRPNSSPSTSTPRERSGSTTSLTTKSSRRRTRCRSTRSSSRTPTASSRPASSVVTSHREGQPAAADRLDQGRSRSSLAAVIRALPPCHAPRRLGGRRPGLPERPRDGSHHVPDHAAARREGVRLHRAGDAALPGHPAVLPRRALLVRAGRRRDTAALLSDVEPRSRRHVHRELVVAARLDHHAGHAWLWRWWRCLAPACAI